MVVEIHTICQIPKLKLSCWGCCGDKFKSQKEVEFEIKENTDDFNLIKIPSTLRLLQFRDRFDINPWQLKKSGICSNLVNFGNGIYACPLHQDINKLVSKKQFLAIHKKDLRWKHCDVNYECDTVIIFSKFTDNQKKDYINWLKKQNFNHYEYSIGNVEGKIIKRYLREKATND